MLVKKNKLHAQVLVAACLVPIFILWEKEDNDACSQSSQTMDNA